jgi:asparagine synthase (glutamine-hydrolysing)
VCGIAGFIDIAKNKTRERLAYDVQVMAEKLRHRGPDSGGTWADAAAGVALGHRRLAVIDLSPTGHQPMCSADGRYVITFNGEIYNYLTLKEELAGHGHLFRGTSDTEVILAGIRQWGVAPLLKKLIGMFAFGLWDHQDRILFLARDRMGEKPLYYGWSGPAFLFGSELKALRAYSGWRGEINRNVLTLFFHYNYIPAPYSIYHGIYKLLPGTYLRLPVIEMSACKPPIPEVYWSLKGVAEEGVRNLFSGSDQEVITELDALLKSAVAGQMIADVPIGAFLSGGVDSSTIVALMQARSNRPVKTFTIGFDDAAYNEAGYAKAVARHLGTDHTEVYVTPRQAMEIIPRLPDLYDEPFADSSQVPTFLLAQLTRQYVSVSLSGDGGDEVFCGYNRHVWLDAIWRKIRWIPLPLRRGMAAFLHHMPVQLSETILRRIKIGLLSDQVQKLSHILAMDNPTEMYLRLVGFWHQPMELVQNSIEPPSLMSEKDRWPALLDFLQQLMYLESATSLPDDMLVKVDRAAMGVSLETRVPLLDHRIVEFSWRLPRSMKIRMGESKWALRQVLSRYVPRSLIERPKAGFGIPIDVWLKGPLRPWAEHLLDPSRLRQEGYLDYLPVRQKWTEHLSGQNKWQPHIWGVLMFEAWLESQKLPA